jgi:hypothetical protein
MVASLSGNFVHASRVNHGLGHERTFVVREVCCALTERSVGVCLEVGTKCVLGSHGKETRGRSGAYTKMGPSNHSSPSNQRTKMADPAFFSRGRVAHNAAFREEHGSGGEGESPTATKRSLTTKTQRKKVNESVDGDSDSVIFQNEGTPSLSCTVTKSY